MKENSKNSYKEINDFFAEPKTSNQKAWDLINDFYHMVLSYMEKNNISKSDLANKLGKSRSAITQMFNKTPNISIRRIVEISDAIGMDIWLASNEIKNPLDSRVNKGEFIVVKINKPVHYLECEYVPNRNVKIKSDHVTAAWEGSNKQGYLSETLYIQ